MGKSKNLYVHLTLLEIECPSFITTAGRRAGLPPTFLQTPECRPFHDENKGKRTSLTSE